MASSNTEAQKPDKVAESLLYMKEHKSLAPEEVTKHPFTGLTTKLKLSDDTHLQQIWSEEMLFFLINKILDAYGDSADLKLGLFRTKKQFGPIAKPIEVSFFPFKYKHDWHLAVGFHKSGRTVIIDCSPPDKTLELGFPVKSVLKMEDYILEFKIKVTKTALKKPITMSPLFTKTSDIQAINVLAVIYTFCCSAELIAGALLKPEKNTLRFDIAQFYKFIKSFDRYSATRDALGDALVDLMIDKSNNTLATGNPKIDPKIDAVMTEKEQKLFPYKVAKKFIKYITEDLEQLLDNLSIMDEFIEMIEQWNHVDSKSGEISTNFADWKILTREVIEVYKDNRNRMVFDEEEVEEILKVDHPNQIFPIIVENGVIYLVNFHNKGGIETEINILLINDKTYSYKKDSVKAPFVKRLAEMYCFRFKRLITKINTARVSVQPFSVYNLLMSLLFYVHYFNAIQKFDIKSPPPDMDVFNYGITFQSLMHAIVTKDPKEVNKFFKRLGRSLPKPKSSK